MVTNHREFMNRQNYLFRMRVSKNNSKVVKVKDRHNQLWVQLLDTTIKFQTPNKDKSNIQQLDQDQFKNKILKKQKQKFRVRNIRVWEIWETFGKIIVSPALQVYKGIQGNK